MKINVVLPFKAGFLVQLTKLLIYVLVSSPMLVNAQTAIEDLPNLAGYGDEAGAVSSFARNGDTIILGGDFTGVYKSDSVYKGFLITNNSGQLKNKRPLHQFEGKINTSVHDGKGGVYIGGEFNSIGDSGRYNIAHIDSTGKVSARFRSLGFNQPVLALLRKGDSLFVGGVFTAAGQQLPKLGAVTDTLGRMKRLPYTNGVLHAMVPDGNGGWFIGGQFDRVGVAVRHNLAHIDSNGIASNWLPNAHNSYVKTLFKQGNILYIGGGFTNLTDRTGATRKFFAAFDLITKKFTTWNIDLNYGVSSIAASGNNVFIGGDFTKVNGQTRNYLAAVNATTGALSSWNPNPNGDVTKILTYQNVVFVVGGFTVIGGQSRPSQVCCIDTGATANINTWNPQSNLPITQIGIYGGRLYVGGWFSTLDMQPRNRIASYYLNSLSLTPWSVNVSGTIVTSMSFIANNVVFGGGFSSVNGVSRENVAMVDTLHGILSAFAAKSIFYPPRFIYAYEGQGGSIVFLTGYATSFSNSISTPNFAVINLRNDSLVSHTVSVNSAVATMCLYNNKLYLGGTFSQVNGQTRIKAAAIDVNTFALTPWAPSMSTGSQIIRTLAAAGKLIFLGGDFTSVNGINRSGLASVDTGTAVLSSWNPNPNNAVSCIATKGNKVYIGGVFTKLGSYNQSYIACLDTNSNVPTSWGSWTQAFEVYAINIQDTIVTVGGETTGDGFGLRRITLNGQVLQNQHPISSTRGDVYTISPLNDDIFVAGGYIRLYNTRIRRGLVSFLLSTKQVLDWPSHFNTNSIYAVKDLKVKDGMLYVCAGDIFRGSLSADTSFEKLTYINQSGLRTIAIKDSILYIGGHLNYFSVFKRLIALNINTKATLPLLLPSPNNYVFSLDIADSLLFIGGNFDSIAGAKRGGFAAINLNTNLLSSQKYDIDTKVGVVYSIKASSNRFVFIGGQFDTVANQKRSNFFAVNSDSAVLSPLSIDANRQIVGLVISDTTFYCSGYFMGIGGKGRNFLAEIDKRTGLATHWNPNPGFIMSGYGNLEKFDSTVFVGGTHNNNVVHSINSSTYARKSYMAFDENGLIVQDIERTVCAPDSMWIPFTLIKNINSPDSFFVELSDKNGSFSNPLKIGGIYTSHSDSIKVYFPPHLPSSRYYTYRVVAKNRTRLRSKYSENYFAISQRPKAGFSISDTLFCSSNYVTLIDTSVRTSDAVYYTEWKINNQTFTSGDTLIRKFSQVGLNTVKLISRTVYSCVDSISRNVMVKRSPKAGFTVNDSIQCFNNHMFIFQDASTLDSGNIVSRLWNFGGGANDTSTSINPPSKQYSIDNDYNVRIVVTSDINCTDTLNRTIIVASEPSSAFSVDDSTKCINSSPFLFSDSTFLNRGVLGRTWYWGDGDTSREANTTKTYSSSGTYTVKLLSASNYGCVDSAYIQVVVFPKPKAGFRVTAYSQCVGNNFTFNDTSSIQTGSYSRRWNFGMGANDTSSLASYTKSYSSTGMYSISLKLTSNEGCLDSANKVVTVSQSPNVGFTVNDSTQCFSGNSFSFNDTSLNATSRIWYFGNGDTSTIINPVKSYSVAGNFNVKLVSSNNGCLDSSIRQIIVFPSPRSGFTVNNYQQCFKGNDFLLIDTSTIISGQLSRFWRFGDGDSSNAISNNKKYNTYGTYNVKLISTSQFGCKDSISKQVAVFASPNPGFTINKTNQCLAGNYFLYRDTSKIDQGSFQRIWSFGNGDTSTFFSHASVYQSTGVYQIKLRLNSNNGCKDSLIKTVNVSPMPKAAFLINNAMQCLSGNVFQFSDSSSLVTGGYSTFWNFGLGALDTSSLDNPTKIYNTQGNFVVRLNIVSDEGCEDSASKIVNVFPKTNISFDINDSSQCLSGNLFYFNNSTTKLIGGSYTSQWKFGDGDSSVQSFQMKSYASQGLYNVKLINTTDKGCRDTLSKFVYVNPHPKAIFFTDTVQCFNGNEFLLVNNSTLNPTSYHWNFGNNASSTQYNPKVSYNSAGTYSIRLVAQNVYGCNDTANKFVRVNPNPILPNLQVSPDSIACKGESIVIKVNSSDQKSWYLNGTKLNHTGDSILVDTSAGYYSVVVTNTNNCSSASYPVSVLFKPNPPKPTISISGNILLSSSTVGNQWYNSSGTISGATNQMYIANLPDQYYTIVTQNNCASPASNTQSYPATDIHHPVQENHSIVLYPNPNDGNFTILFQDKPQSNEVTITIVDMLGRLVYVRQYASSLTYTLNTTMLTSGAYNILVSEEHKNYKRIPLVIVK